MWLPLRRGDWEKEIARQSRSWRIALHILRLDVWVKVVEIISIQEQGARTSAVWAWGG